MTEPVPIQYYRTRLHFTVRSVFFWGEKAAAAFADGGKFVTKRLENSS